MEKLRFRLNVLFLKITKRFGARVKVYSCRWGKGIRLEDGVRIIGTGIVSIGDNFYANASCHFLGNISIGDNVLVGPKTVIWSRNHGFAKDQLIREQKHKDEPIHIHSDCWIGASCIILPGVTIGKGAVIGAGSVVTSDIEPYSVNVGNPARKIGYRA